MLRIFGVHGPDAAPDRLAAMVAAMDKALDPGIYRESLDIAPAPSLLLRLRATSPERLARGFANQGAVTVAGLARLYDEAGDKAGAPEHDLSRIAGMLDRAPAAYPHRSGEFGIAVYDSKRSEFRIATDAFGAAPMYYARFGELFAFANWPHLLLALPQLSREIDPVAAAAYIGSVPQPQDRTFFKGLRRLAPAQSLTRTSDGAETLEIHWRPGPSLQASNLDDVAEAARTAIRSRLLHSTQPAIEISGGLDSSLIAGLATNLRPDLRFAAISNILPARYRGEATDEKAYIDAVLAACPAISPGFVSSDGLDVFSGAEDAWDRLAAPCFDSYRFMTISALERTTNSDAVINGFGGDQCFSAGGGPFLYEMLASGRIGAALGEWARLRRVYGTGRLSLLHHTIFSRLPVFPAWKALRSGPLINDVLTETSDPQVEAHLLRWDFRRHVANESSMRRLETDGLASIEDWMVRDHEAPASGRSIANLKPLLDPRLIEAVMAAPSDLKVAGGYDRALLRAVAGDSIPALVANRIDKKPFSPDYLTLVAARAPDISRSFERFRSNPVWREFVDPAGAEAALARLAAAPARADLDAVLGQVVCSYYFGLFVERAFD